MPKTDLVSPPSHCALCPRRCGVDRAAGAVGFCGAGRTLKPPALPCILGGALHQRHPWQRHRVLFRLHPQVLLLPELPHQRRRAGQGDQRGASGRNLSQPAGTGSPQHQSGHARPVAALDHCRTGSCPGTGPASAIVCNTGGYETVENVEAWRGYIDIWLADLKYVSPALSAELSAAPDYFAQAKPAIEAMMAQAGHPVFDADGILQRGVILRHLALPGHVDDSFAVLDQMAAWNDADPGCFLPSVMSQYTPFYKAAEHGIGRRITTYEYHRVVNYAMDKGLVQGYMQQKSSAKEEYTPQL